ncbi:hypothetical protein [Bacillus thuringiensis]|uniref:hypothetical protein n=1 Tax=Bacillus thuringiensis TaxID=1428 RepID=UPI001596A28C|nr:hypothetical protein [Bacillus thuringiensis]
MNKKNGLNSNKEKCDNLEFSSSDKWQYESYYKYQPLFSFKDLLKLFTRKEKQ